MSVRACEASSVNPARAAAADIDVRERSVRSVGMVQANSANQIWIGRFDSLDGFKNHSRVAEINAAVVVEVVHPSVAVTVDDDIGRIAELVAAVA